MLNSPSRPNLMPLFKLWFESVVKFAGSEFGQCDALFSRQFNHRAGSRLVRHDGLSLFVIGLSADAIALASDVNAYGFLSFEAVHGLPEDFFNSAGCSARITSTMASNS